MLDALQASAGLTLGLAFAFGLLIGSFLNVVILRLPPWMEWQWRRESRELLELPEPYEPAPPGIVVQGSACPKCGHKLAAWENIPVLSYLVLRGRCRGCGTGISLQYPVVELVTAILFAACAWRFGASFETLAAMGFTGLLVALAGIDLRTTLLPDQLTLSLLWIGLGLSTITLFTSPTDAIFGAIAGYLSLWTVYKGFKLLTGKEGMGYGDFKLLAMLGAWGGWQVLPLTILLSSLVGAVLGVIMLRLRNQETSTPIPFGPYLAIAGWIALLWGDQITATYLQFAGFR